MGRSDAARFWQKLKTDGQSRRGRCSEGLRISTSEEEAEGMRSRGQELAQDGRGRGNPLSNPLRPGSPSGVYRYGGAHGGKKEQEERGEIQRGGSLGSEGHEREGMESRRC